MVLNRHRRALVVLSSLGMLFGAARPASAETPAERPCVVDGSSAMPDWTWTSATTVERQLTMDGDADDRAEPSR